MKEGAFMKTKLDIRRNTILNILAKVPISSTQELAKSTGVSIETMRKDLDVLAEEGLIVKMHGGVAITNSNAAEVSFDSRIKKNVVGKRKIAQKAITLIAENESVILESCTTNLELARVLLTRPDLLATLSVITNSFSIVSLFEGGGLCQSMFFLGGQTNSAEHCCQGQQTVNMLKQFHVSKAFLSGAALSEQLILAGFNEYDIAFQKNAIQAANQTILMADYKKFGKPAIYSVCSLAEIDYLVTDKKLNEAEIDILKKHQVICLQAD